MDILSAVPEGLENVYQQSFRKIPTKLKASSQLLLRWVLFARRPLKTIELIYALVCSFPHKSQATCESSGTFVRCDDMEYRIWMLSGGLLETSNSVKSTNEDGTNEDGTDEDGTDEDGTDEDGTDEDDTDEDDTDEDDTNVDDTNDDDNSIYGFGSDKGLRVQFIHESMRDFFITGDGQTIFGKEVDGERFIGNSHEILKQSCINYLTLEEMSMESKRYAISDGAFYDEVIDLFDPNRYLTGQELARELKRAYPFLNYAIKSILFHASRAETAGISQVSLGRSYLDPVDRFFSLWGPLHSMLRYLDNIDSLSAKRSQLLPELARYDVMSCLRYIQESGACIDPADFCETTSLQLAVEHDHLNVVHLLIKEHDVRFETCTRALLATISKGHLDIARALLDRDVDPNVIGMRTTPLKEAILGGHTSFARYLIDRGVDVNGRGQTVNNETPLQAAVGKGLEDLVKALLSQGADPNAVPATSYYYDTALVRAAQLGNIHIILTLLDHGALLDGCGPETPLQMAIQAGNLRVADLLLNKGANVRASG